ncbi:MAG: dihydroorotate dehydrogenase electron transfer subunit [Holosporaceae bacterium]|nr:dihydroorotate dehydrogenase electron transfer subunit [Holosporaceae bacterium]
MKKITFDCSILENVRLATGVFKTTLDASAVCKTAKPGQFIHIKTGGEKFQLLRRPISIADVSGDRLSIIYRVVGDGTRWLSERGEGELIDVMGPLGNGFELNAKKPLLVGGGIGIAPLLYLARAFGDSSSDVLLATRSEEETTYWLEMFSSFCSNVHIATNDGSLGTRGNALDILPNIAGSCDAIYSCGPAPMLRAVSDFALKANIPCQLSLESHMACGLGVCLSCSCASSDGKRKKICVDGPVFKAGEIEL